MSYKSKRSIIIYFSRADENYWVWFVEKWNTEIVAEFIQELSGADMFKVERKIPYAKDYDTCIKQAQEEQRNNKRPELVQELSSIDEYEIIYIWAPVYRWVLLQPMVTQLEKLNREKKIVRPFTTHEGSWLGEIPEQLEEICSWAMIFDWLAIRWSAAHSSKDTVERWLEG